MIVLHLQIFKTENFVVFYKLSTFGLFLKYS